MIGMGDETTAREVLVTGLVPDFTPSEIYPLGLGSGQVPVRIRA